MRGKLRPAPREPCPIEADVGPSVPKTPPHSTRLRLPRLGCIFPSLVELGFAPVSLGLWNFGTRQPGNFHLKSERSGKAASSGRQCLLNAPPPRTFPLPLAAPCRCLSSLASPNGPGIWLERAAISIALHTQSPSQIIVLPPSYYQICMIYILIGTWWRPLSALHLS